MSAFLFLPCHEKAGGRDNTVGTITAICNLNTLDGQMNEISIICLSSIEIEHYGSLFISLIFKQEVVYLQSCLVVELDKFKIWASGF